MPGRRRGARARPAWLLGPQSALQEVYDTEDEAVVGAIAPQGRAVAWKPCIVLGEQQPISPV